MRKKKNYHFHPLVIGAVLLFLGGCSGDPPAEPVSPPVASSGELESVGSAGDLVFDLPSSWVSESPSSSMRLAQYRLPRAEGDAEDGQLVIFYFGGQGGATQANVDRWIGQFTAADGSSLSEEARISEQQSNGLKLTQVDVSGTYHESRGPMMGQTTPRPDYRMLAVVVEGPGGPWFLKLTGPRATVEHSEEEFSTFLKTLRVGS